eukprot:scaffold4958_cov406-Prasinococcus_capsulatus_cf.AAC.20
MTACAGHRLELQDGRPLAGCCSTACSARRPPVCCSVVAAWRTERAGCGSVPEPHLRETLARPVRPAGRPRI